MSYSFVFPVQINNFTHFFLQKFIFLSVKTNGLLDYIHFTTNMGEGESFAEYFSLHFPKMELFF